LAEVALRQDRLRKESSSADVPWTVLMAVIATIVVINSIRVAAAAYSAAGFAVYFASQRCC
jgi:hypothetical protein